MRELHPRLGELESAYGWTREWLVEGRRYASGHEVRTTIDERTVSLSCYQFRREGLRWVCVAHWHPPLRRSQRKRLKKQSSELIEQTFDPAARRLLGPISDPTHARVEDGFQVGTGAISFGASREPPPAETLVGVAGAVARMATSIEDVLHTDE